MSIESVRHRSHHPPLHLCNCFLERLHSRQWQRQLGSQEENMTIRPYLAEKSSIQIDISIILMSQQTWHLDVLSRKCLSLACICGRPGFLQGWYSVTLKGRKNLAKLQIWVARFQIWVIDDKGLTKGYMVCPFKECLTPLMSGSQLHGHCWCRLQTLKPHLHCDIWLDLRTCGYHLTIRQERIPVSVSLVW